MPELVNEVFVGRRAVRLRPFVDDYVGYRFAGLAPGVHAGLPSRTLTFIIAFDEPLDVSSRPNKRDRYWAMVAGLHATPASVHHNGAMRGIQLSVTPPGALALFGMPSGALASTQIHFDDIAPGVAGELVDRLGDASSWTTRWNVLDDVLGRMLDDAATIPTPLAAAWSMLAATDGAVKIDDLAVDVGWSRRTLSHRFRTEFGLTPKLAARIMRFERSQRLLRSPLRPELASVAASCGYADQAHMTRDWKEFAGAPPRTWLRAENVPIVQDDGHAELQP